MAAILCSACSDICSGTCDAVGTVCGKTCSGCAQACNGLCDCFGDACQGIAKACASPFSIVVAVAVIFNVPCVYLGVQEITNLQCRGSQWLFVNGLFCAANIAASIYMALVVAKADDEPLDMENPSPRRPSTAFGRAGHLLCYDPIMAIYLLALMAFICWLWTGGIWMLNGKADNGCSGLVEGRIIAGLSFAWAFFFCGIGALCCGMCCAYCGVGENTSNNASSVPNYGAAATTTTTTPFINVDNIPDSTKKQEGTQAPVAAATPEPSAPTKQEEIPTVTATLF